MGLCLNGGKGLSMLDWSAGTVKAGDISAMTIPLEGVSMRGQGIEDIDR